MTIMPVFAGMYIKSIEHNRLLFSSMFFSIIYAPRNFLKNFQLDEIRTGLIAGSVN
jgi:hypothetical protein